MPDFAYTARSLAGELLQGTLSAGTQREAMAALSAKELFPLKVEPAKGAVTGSTDGSIRVASAKVTPVYSQLAALLRSGVPLLRSLAVVKEQASDKNLKAVMEDIHAQVEQGASLAEAMARHPRAFGELTVSMIRAGGEGGFLEDSLDRVADFTEQQAELRGKVMGALAYPMILSVIGVLIVSGLIVFAVPMVAEIFDRLKEKGELPWMTEALLALSGFLGTYGIFVLLALGGLGWGLSRWMATERGRGIVDQVRIRTPLYGPIARSLAVSRLCRVLGTLLQGGVPIVRALDISADSAGNRILTAVVRDAAEHIKSGESLAEPLSKSRDFPPDVVEMIAVAEQSNSLETVLEQVANSLERTTWRKIELAVRLIEPLMLCLLAGAVLMVVMALLMPIINAGGAL